MHVTEEGTAELKKKLRIFSHWQTLGVVEKPPHVCCALQTFSGAEVACGSFSSVGVWT